MCFYCSNIINLPYAYIYRQLTACDEAPKHEKSLISYISTFLAVHYFNVIASIDNEQRIRSNTLFLLLLLVLGSLIQQDLTGTVLDYN